MGSRPMSRRRALATLREMEQWYATHEEEHAESAARWKDRPGFAPEESKAAVEAFAAGAKAFRRKKQAIQFALAALVPPRRTP